MGERPASTIVLRERRGLLDTQTRIELLLRTRAARTPRPRGPAGRRQPDVARQSVGVFRASVELPWHTLESLLKSKRTGTMGGLPK